MSKEKPCAAGVISERLGRIIPDFSVRADLVRDVIADLEAAGFKIATMEEADQFRFPARDPIRGGKLT